MAHLVGRAEELGVVQDLLGWPGLRLVEIVGEPGIGKTRLLAEIRQLAAGHGRRVLAGQAGELAGAVPFAVLVDALDDVLAGGRPTLSDPSLALLAEVLPAVEEFVPAERTVGGERFRIHAALSDLLEWLATPNGLVLTLDDVHWADEATSELLGRLMRQPPRQPVLIVLAYRPRQQPRHLAAALATGHSEVLELTPLSRAQTAELLGPGVSQHRLNKLFQLSGGNPLYLDALSKVGTLASFDAVLHAELDGLSEQSRHVAHAAAVLDDPFALDVVAHVAELSFLDTNQALADLVACDLIRQDGVRWRYRHPLVRRAAYRSASRGWLHGAHARAARALTSAPVIMRAPHVMRVAQVGDEEAVELLAEAAREVLPQGPATSAQWLRAAVDLLPDNDYRRLGLLGELGNALALSGSLHESRDVLQAVLHQLPTDEPERRVAAVVSSARVEQLLGRHPEARGLLLAELRRLPETARREKAFLELEMGSVGLISCDFQIDLAWITDALSTARDLGDRALEAGAYAVLALAAYGFGEVTAALDWQCKGAKLVDELSDETLATRLDVTATLGWAELYLAQPRAALRHIDRGLAVSTRTGQTHQLVYLLTARAMALHLMGDLVDATANAAEAVEAAELSASDKLRAAAYTIQGMVATAQRDRELALRAGIRAARAAEDTPDWWSAVAGCSLGGARLINGDIDGCVTDLLRLAGGRALPLLDPLHRPVFATALVVAELSRGRLDEARAWITMMEQAVATSRGGEVLPNRRGQIALSHARWHLAAQTPAEAVEWASQAVDAFAEIDHVLQEAESRQVLGTALAAAGDAAGAINELTQTAKLYDTCSMPSRRDGVYKQLRALGHNVHAPRSTGTRSALPQLTPREAEVAQLVADGLTNREIGLRLQLSRRTVETHISNIRVKLDVASRAALAATVIRAAQPGSG